MSHKTTLFSVICSFREPYVQSNLGLATTLNKIVPYGKSGINKPELLNSGISLFNILVSG